MPRFKPGVWLVICAILIMQMLSACARTRSGFYQPAENADVDYNDESSQWSFSRSRESKHFYLFWGNGFGDDPDSDILPDSMRVDVSEMMEKLEQYYETNTQTLGFLPGGLLDGRKMQVYLLYTEDWVATGSGYDNAIGVLWASPAACQPVGSVIAHEVGHCFQYLVYCEQLARGRADDSQSGFRYAYNDGNGNAFWEICAQWQSWQDYPAEQFTDYEMDTWFCQYFRAFENEWTRYENYWLLDYMAQRRGVSFLSRLWSESRDGEDALSAYTRLYLDGDVEKLYAELYEYAARAVTFDFDSTRCYADSWQGRYQTTLYDAGDGFSRVAYGNCPEACGFNAIPIELSEGTTCVTVDFEGLLPGSALAPRDPGEYDIAEDVTSDSAATVYNAYDGAPGWRYGFVALSDTGKRTYGEMYSADSAALRFDIPDGTAEVYFVVLGAPREYACHVWDDNELTDVQMPYQVRIAVY